MSNSRHPSIPAFYRFYFKWSDPIVLIWAVYMDFFAPDTVITAFLPASIAPWNPRFEFLLQQLGGALLMLATLEIVLLRYTDDISIWKILEGATLIYDLVLLYSIYHGLKQQDRLSLHGLRAEDWADIGITGVAALIRSAFLLNVGLGDWKGSKKRQ